MSVAAAVGARVWSAGAVLADPTDVGDETHKGGPLAILVIAVLCIGCFFLFRSMSKHLRRVRDDFGDGPGAPTDPAAADPRHPAAPTDAADDAVAGTADAARPAPGTVRPAPKSRTRADHPAGR